MAVADVYPGVHTAVAGCPAPTRRMVVVEREDEQMVPGDADDMAEALGEISEALGCANTKEDILHAIDELRANKRGGV